MADFMQRAYSMHRDIVQCGADGDHGESPLVKFCLWGLRFQSILVGATPGTFSLCFQIIFEEVMKCCFYKKTKSGDFLASVSNSFCRSVAAMK